MYEGYAPAASPSSSECLTDNRNRAAAEVRTALSRNGGNLADPGSVARSSTAKGVVIVPKADGCGRGRDPRGRPSTRAPRRSTTTATAEIVSRRPIRRRPQCAVQDAGIDYDSAEASFVPNLQVPLDLEAPAG